MAENKKQMSLIEAQKIKQMMDDPVIWAQIFVTIFDNATKKYTPWTARWYQVEMLRDRSIKKVARCGRRTGKTETMCIEMLWKAFTKPMHRILVVTPYETQVRLIFTRLNEIINESPLVKKELKRVTKNPYWIEFNNGAIICGFTTGASSGSGGASIRGQRADAIYMDEVDYMSEADFDSVMAIAGERPDITIFMSSTPTGKRSKFWLACTNPKMGFKEHFHPSMHNPNFDERMDAEFKAQLSEQGYVHEILAEFGTQDTGVFDKNKIDAAREGLCYAYNDLDYYQELRCKENNINPKMFIYDKEN